MSEGQHDLAHEFPAHRDRIHALKSANHHFARLLDEYHGVSKELHRVEAEIETPADTVVEELKKRRLRLKDELYAMLVHAD